MGNLSRLMQASLERAQGAMDSPYCPGCRAATTKNGIAAPTGTGRAELYFTVGLISGLNPFPSASEPKQACTPHQKLPRNTR